MDIIELRPDQLEDWDSLVKESKQGTVFHTSWWLQAHRAARLRSAATRTRFIGAFENGRLVAGLPITYRRVLGRNLILPPYLTPYLGPFFMSNGESKPVTENSWHKKLNGLFARELLRWGTVLTYPFSRDANDIQPYIWAGLNPTVRYTYILNLSDLNRVFDRLDKKRRRDIKKFEESGYRIALADIDVFEHIVRCTFERQKARLPDLSLIVNLISLAKTKGRGQIFLAEDSNGAPLSTCAMVWDSKRSYLLAGGTYATETVSRSALIWHCIRFTAEQLSLKELDFEGSMIHSIEYYYRKFGGDLKPVLGVSGSSYSLYRLLRRGLKT